MFLKYMAFLLFLSSCALFKGTRGLENENKEKLLNAIQLIGEGRGRLSLSKNQYVFSFDSLLKENYDWILAVSIPLQGEEVMSLVDLRKKEVLDSETESFEARIDHEFKNLKLNKILTSKEFLNELRSVIRFNLAHKLGLKRNCMEHQKDLVCTLDEEKFFISVSGKEFNIIKLLGRGRRVVLEGRNLTESFFSQINIRLYSNEVDFEKKNSSFSLELFWK